MNARTRYSIAVAGIATMTILGLGACSSDSGGSSSDDGMTASDSPSTSASPSEEAMPSDDASMDPAANLVGPGCADYAAQVPTGPGSVTGMSTEPVAVAASNNPLLKTLTAAVSGQLNPDVNLVDTLNGGQFTVFAPVDDAFAQVPSATIDSLKTDSAGLTKVLTYHVVPGELLPDQIVGTHTTVEGGTVTVTGSGDDLKVNDATVICGGVVTANAVVYLVDTVLMPPS